MYTRAILIHSLMALSLLTWLVGAAQATDNTILGTGAGANLGPNAHDNTLIGVNAGFTMTDSDDNTLVGSQAGESTTGSFNTMVGEMTGFNNTGGANNAFFGDSAGFSNITGENNTYLGRSAGFNNQTGFFNVFVGRSAGSNEFGSNKLYIDNVGDAFPLIYGEFDNDLVGINGALGVGTQMPMDKLHVREGNLRIEQTAANAILNFIAGANTWQITTNQTTGRLVFFSPDGAATTGPFKFDLQATENLFRVGVLGASTVDINGDLVVDGDLLVTGTITPDYVFTPEYALESIEAHAAYMWENKHLPAVGAGQVNAQGQGMVNVGARSQGMLEELEKAHIYIEQLHGEMTRLKRNEAALTRKVIALEANEAELEALKGEVTGLKEKEAQLEGLLSGMAELKALVQQFMAHSRDTAPGEEG